MWNISKNTYTIIYVGINNNSYQDMFIVHKHWNVDCSDFCETRISDTNIYCGHS